MANTFRFEEDARTGLLVHVSVVLQARGRMQRDRGGTATVIMMLCDECSPFETQQGRSTMSRPALFWVLLGA